MNIIQEKKGTVSNSAIARIRVEIGKEIGEPSRSVEKDEGGGMGSLPPNSRLEKRQIVWKEIPGSDLTQERKAEPRKVRSARSNRE